MPLEQALGAGAQVLSVPCSLDRQFMARQACDLFGGLAVQSAHKTFGVPDGGQGAAGGQRVRSGYRLRPRRPTAFEPG